MTFLLSVLMVAVLVSGFVTPALAGDEKKPGAAAPAPGSAGDKSATDSKPQSEGAASPATGDKGTPSASPSAAPAPPASKNDCKDTGWQKLGFKNQGECVSAVAPEKKP